MAAKGGAFGIMLHPNKNSRPLDTDLPPPPLPPAAVTRVPPRSAVGGKGLPLPLPLPPPPRAAAPVAAAPAADADAAAAAAAPTRPTVGGKGVPRSEGETEGALAALLDPVVAICGILLPLIQGEECSLNKKVFESTMKKLVTTGEGTAVKHAAPLLFNSRPEKIRAPSWWTDVKNLPQTVTEIQQFLQDFSKTEGAADYVHRNIVSWRKICTGPSFDQLKYPFHLWLLRCLKSAKMPADDVVKAFEKMDKRPPSGASANRKPAHRVATAKPLLEDADVIQPESDPDDSADKEDSDDFYDDDDEPEEVVQSTKKRKRVLSDSTESEDDGDDDDDDGESDGEPAQKSARTSLRGRLDKIRRSLKDLSEEVLEMELVDSDQAAQATAQLEETIAAHEETIAAHEETIAEQEKAISELGEANIKLGLDNATLTTSAGQRDARIAELEASNANLTERLKATIAAFATLSKGL
jgi:hypothetical protein